MLYFDTSFLIPLVLQEPTSEAIDLFMGKLASEELTASHWVRVEFVSMLAREVRMGGLTVEGARRAEAAFEDALTESFLVILPTVHDFERARKLLAGDGSGLRAGDAFHLAIALNHGAEAVYSLDKRMIDAGRAFGLSMNAGFVVAGY